jgi:hypothetical protein
MADVYSFYDMSAPGGTVGTLRYDFSSYVAGRPGDENVVFGAPQRLVSRSETFVRPGAYIAPEYHDGTRQIRIPIGIKGSSWDAAAAIWEDLVAELSDFPLALKVQIHNASEAAYFEVLASSTWNLLSETWDQRSPATTIRGELLLECQPYPIGTSSPSTFIGAGS